MNTDIMMQRMRKLHAKIVTEDYGVISLGTERGIQVVQVDVWEIEQEVEHHIIVLAYYLEIDRPSCTDLENRLGELFGDIIISFSVKDEPGKAILFVTPKQQNQSSFLFKAAAIVVVKRAWGWDESKMIQVRCENTGEQIELENPRYENGQFEIEV